MAEGEETTMSKLQKLLEDQLADAKKNAGRKIVRKLPGGLRIEIECVSNDVRLTLTRDSQYPSIQEWLTVIDHFPYAVPRSTAAEHKQEGSRYTISARFPSKRTIQTKFF